MNLDIQKAWENAEDVIYTLDDSETPQIVVWGETMPKTFMSGKKYGDILFLNWQTKRRYIYFEIYNIKTGNRYSRKIPAFS